MVGLPELPSPNPGHLAQPVLPLTAGWLGGAVILFCFCRLQGKHQVMKHQDTTEDQNFPYPTCIDVMHWFEDRDPQAKYCLTQATVLPANGPMMFHDGTNPTISIAQRD